MLQQNTDFTAVDSGVVVAVLLEIQTLTPIYLVSDNVDWTFNGHAFQSFPFKLDNIEANGKGEIPKTTIQVSNVTGSVLKAIEENGVDNIPIILRVVRAGEDTADVELNFVVTSISYNQEWININLGAPISYVQSFPRLNYSEVCPWQYKDWRCKCSSNLASCNKSITDCKARNNEERFGGFQNELN